MKKILIALALLFSISVQSQTFDFITRKGVIKTGNLFDSTATAGAYVPQTRMVAGFALSSNVTLATLSAGNGITLSSGYNGSTARSVLLDTLVGSSWSHLYKTIDSMKVVNTGLFFKQGGNAFGATTIVGNTDNFDLDIKQRDSVRAMIVTGRWVFGTNTVGLTHLAPSTDVPHQFNFVNTGSDQFMNYVAFTASPNYHESYSRGTQTTPSVVLSGDIISSHGYRAWDGTDWSGSMAAFQVKILENANTGQGSAFLWGNTPIGVTANSGRIGTMILTTTGLRIGDNTAPTNRLEVAGNISSIAGASGTIVDGTKALSVTGTFPSSSSGANWMINNIFTTAGSSAQNQYGQYMQMAAGYTGANTVLGAFYDVRSAGTASGLNLGVSGGIAQGNGGFAARTLSTTTGMNFGVSGEADGGNKNVGVIGNATVNKNSATNAGGIFYGFNGGTSPIHMGTASVLGSTEVTYISAAGFFSNGTTTDPIAVFRDNNTTVLTVADGGNITSTASLIMSGSTSVIRVKGYTVATLPAGTQGDMAFVSDALAPTFLATIVGGGSVVTPVFYNGSAWVGY